MDLEEFITQTGLRALILPAPDLPIPEQYPRRYGFKAYKVTLRHTASEKNYSLPFFSTDAPYAAQIIRSLAGDASWFEQGPEPDVGDADGFLESLAGAKKIADDLKTFFGDKLYETLMTEVELET